MTLYLQNYRDYFKKKVKRCEAWESNKENLLWAFFEEIAPANDVCVKCKKLAKDIIHCNECGLHSYFFEGLLRPDGHKCATLNPLRLVVVDEQGFFKTPYPCYGWQREDGAFETTKQWAKESSIS
ncbi:hypothetical protein CAPTEDRAFT_199639 [Capitella teleta]|uniref:Uncharacterized protein n=1 Tax=Capitella teleta TaxID=283909 RepID=R7U948_CAPTE|nr:hypothetical protein CAPTEDRAFT_199639 [Capitella teleta]|eukprot:ELU02666.1 hypothetical protein CAPTEDRAFT_199639 [Capitella teleta]